MSERHETPPPPKLLDRLRAKTRLLHSSIRTEEAYAAWSTKFILFHHQRHPEDMDTTLEDHAVDALRYALMSRPQASLPRAPRQADYEVKDRGRIVVPVKHLPDVFTDNAPTPYYL